MGGIYWLASYPKSGNTWFRTFLRNLIADGEAPADINELITGSIASARGWLDEVLGFDTAELDPDEVDRLRPLVYRWSAAHGDVEYHKVHDAWQRLDAGEPMLSQEATLGALYLIRNPLDVAPSYANHNRSDIDAAIASMADRDHALSRSRRRLFTQTRQRMFDWSGHVRSWVDAEGLDCEVVRYEDMLADPLATFTRAARFLNLPDAPECVAKAIRFSSFDEVARQERDKGFHERPPGVESFFRQGTSGDWRARLSDEQVGRIVADHGEVMRRFGYLDSGGLPV
jgi:hypothetical protein